MQFADLKASKIKAVEQYKIGNYEEAIDVFSKILSALEDIDCIKDHQSEEIIELKLSCLNNLVITHNKVGSFEICIIYATQIIDNLRPNSVKALYGRAQAYAAIGKVSNSIEDLEKILQIENGNQQAVSLLHELSGATNTFYDQFHNNPNQNSIHTTAVPNVENPNSTRENGLENKQSEEERVEESPSVPMVSIPDQCYSFMNPSWSLKSGLTSGDDNKTLATLSSIDYFSKQQDFDLESITANIGAIASRNAYRQKSSIKSDLSVATTATAVGSYGTCNDHYRTQKGFQNIDVSPSVVNAIKELILAEEETVATVMKKKISTTCNSNLVKKKILTACSRKSSSSSTLLPPVSLMGSQSIWEELMQEEQQRLNIVAERILERNKKAAAATRNPK